MLKLITHQDYIDALEALLLDMVTNCDYTQDAYARIARLYIFIEKEKKRIGGK